MVLVFTRTQEIAEIVEPYGKVSHIYRKADDFTMFDLHEVPGVWEPELTFQAFKKRILQTDLRICSIAGCSVLSKKEPIFSERRQCKKNINESFFSKVNCK